MRGLNKVIIIGQVGRDPEMRFTTNGRSVTTFPVATSRIWIASNGDRREETEWFNVVAWGGLAEVCKQRLRKGMYVYVEGRLQTRGWEDAEGRRHYRTELVANQMIFLGEGRAPIQTFGEEEETSAEEETSEEFPFG
ncbi:MAG: single-stranded DNA-binding protein [Anaerolineae bacterium]|nr:single-stranded DNA-binding protein [Thermoflexus sp.]MDW8064776.1 single-stranded DNA-binding protein [Anaerolineae bacterium]